MSCARAHRSAFLLLYFCLLTIVSCRTTSEPTNETRETDTIVSTTPPFQTKEPERYSATRTTTIIPPSGDPVVSRTLIAKDGPMRREEPQGQTARVIYLELPEGRFTVLPDDKVYAASTEYAPADSDTAADEDSPDLLLHKDPISTTYQSLGNETIAGRPTAKYRVVVNNSAAENVRPNETLMWIDGALKMPIKTETKSPDGTRVVMELTDLALDPDKQLFQIPADCKKTVFTELQKQLNRPRLNP